MTLIFVLLIVGGIGYWRFEQDTVQEIRKRCAEVEKRTRLNRIEQNGVPLGDKNFEIQPEQLKFANEEGKAAYQRCLHEHGLER